MKVKELIKILENEDQEKNIMIRHECDECDMINLSDIDVSLDYDCDVVILMRM